MTKIESPLYPNSPFVLWSSYWSRCVRQGYPPIVVRAFVKIRLEICSLPWRMRIVVGSGIDNPKPKKIVNRRNIGTNRFWEGLGIRTCNLMRRSFSGSVSIVNFKTGVSKTRYAFCPVRLLHTNEIISSACG